MLEKDIINKIKELKQIKPQKDWVFSFKADLFKDEIKESFNFFSLFNKPALAGLIMSLMFFGLFGFAQTSVPGDLLYPVKKMAEKGQLAFISEENRTENSLVMADKRLEELAKIVQSNQVKKLATAINEVEASVSTAARNISKTGATSSSPVAVKNIVDKTKEIEFKIEEIRALGVVIGGAELLQEERVKLEGIEDSEEKNNEEEIEEIEEIEDSEKIEEELDETQQDVQEVKE